MDFNEYLIQSERTLVQKGKDLNLLHGAIGISTEAGEILDAFKRHIYYGKELDVVNIKEEIGDIMWYVAILCRELNLNMEDILQTNIDKLKARYPDKFSETHALNRNLENERKILEGKNK
jgi:NTP pyrophosphatase (non-canonical NTP hydrolase)